jgi:hypothetical protein
VRNDRLIAVSSTCVKIWAGYHFLVYLLGGIVFLESDVEWIAGLAIWILIVSFVLYFLPTMIAVARKHRNALPIFILNLFLGWTFLGWIVSLVWCFTAQDRDHNQRE